MIFKENILCRFTRSFLFAFVSLFCFQVALLLLSQKQVWIINSLITQIHLCDKACLDQGFRQVMDLQRIFRSHNSHCFRHASGPAFGWWAQVDSNHRPHAYQACALTTWAMRPMSGDEEDRTPDPLLAKQVLSQLSYTPRFSFQDALCILKTKQYKSSETELLWPGVEN